VGTARESPAESTPTAPERKRKAGTKS
jgi:hypothetical protein